MPHALSLSAVDVTTEAGDPVHSAVKAIHRAGRLKLSTRRPAEVVVDRSDVTRVERAGYRRWKVSFGDGTVWFLRAVPCDCSG